MKLVYKETQTPVRIGDEVILNHSTEIVHVDFFREPHKPSSEGKITVRNQDGQTSEYYVGVIGAEWIEREDHAQFIPDTVQAVVPNTDYRKKKKKTAKPRVHNEWFRTVSLGGRKTCPGCKAMIEPGESIWSWGEYVNAKWRTVIHFCKSCYSDRVRGPLQDHILTCACKVEFVGYRGDKLPDWLKLD